MSSASESARSGIVETFAMAGGCVKLLRVERPKHGDTPNPVDIRRAQAGDEPFIEDLSQPVFSEYTPRAGPKTLRMSTDRGAHTLVAVSGARRVGFAVWVADNAHAHLD